MSRLHKALAAYVSMNGDADLDRIQQIVDVEVDCSHDSYAFASDTYIDIWYRYGWPGVGSSPVSYSVPSSEATAFLTFLAEFEEN